MRRRGALLFARWSEGDFWQLESALWMVAKPSMDKVAAGNAYVFQQDSASLKEVKHACSRSKSRLDKVMAANEGHAR